LAFNLEKSALVAEVVSGAAVLITLIFLVIGIGENTDATRAAVYRDISDGINQFNLILVDDPALARLWSGRFDVSLDSMESDDAERIVYMNRVLFRNLDSAYFSFRNGSLGSAQWERFHTAACRNYPRQDAGNEALKGVWELTEPIASREFVSYLERTCPEIVFE